MADDLSTKFKHVMQGQPSEVKLELFALFQQGNQGDAKVKEQGWEQVVPL